MKKLILVAALVAIGAAVKLLPWWAGLLLLVGGGLGVVLLGKKLFTQFFLGAFKAKSAVLEGARARVRGITPAEPYKPDDLDEEDDLFDFEEPMHWVYVDLDVEVADNPATPMNYWAPDELSFVTEDAVADDFESDEEVGTVYGVEAFENGAWVTVEDKVAGSQRLRLHVAAKSGVDRFRIRYYFELLENAG